MISVTSEAFAVWTSGKYQVQDPCRAEPRALRPGRGLASAAAYCRGLVNYNSITMRST